MTLEDLTPAKPTLVELVQMLEMRLLARTDALKNLKVKLGEHYDRSKALQLYRALEDTIKVLNREQPQYCTMPQILHHADLMIFRAKIEKQYESADFYKQIREELKKL